MLHSLAPKSEKTENAKGKLKKTEMCLIVCRFHPPVAAVTHEHLAVKHSFQRAGARKGIVDDSQGCIIHSWRQTKIQSCL